MRLAPITSADSLPFSFRCAGCAARSSTDSDPGARADLDGAPFAAYYCGGCSAKLSAPPRDPSGLYAEVERVAKGRAK